MHYLLKTFFAAVLFIPSLIFADNLPFQEGRDYVTLSSQSQTSAKKEIQVIEFFNYGCPACYRLSPVLQTWLKQKPSFVTFSRIPTIFHPDWETISKAYYVANYLHVENKIDKPIFSAIHEQNLMFNSKEELEPLFLKAGIQKETFEKMFDSEKIQTQMKKDNELAEAYQINSIPTIVINGKYQTSPGMVGNDFHRFLAVVNFLIAKERGGIN